MNGFELYKKLKDLDNKIEACFITAFEDYLYRRSSKTYSCHSRISLHHSKARR